MGAMMDMESRVANLEKMMQEQKECMAAQNTQLAYIMEQVTLGKHIITFAKLMGWIIGVAATGVEVWRAMKGH